MHLPTILRPRRAVRSLLALAAAVGLAGCANAPLRRELESENVSIRAFGEDPKTFDPSVSYTTSEAPITSLLNPCFYRYDYYKQGPFVLQPNLGASMPILETLKPEKKGDAVEHWTYRIRRDLRFQDDPCFPEGKGRKITASDFVYSFKRACDGAVQCPVASYLADKIVGWTDDAKLFDKLKGKAYDHDLTGVRTVPGDPYAFTIDLNQPYPQLKYLMAMSFTSPQSREAVEKYGDQYGLHHPISCGPYLLKEYVPHDHLYLERNPNAPPEVFPTDADPAFAGVLADAGKPVGFLKGIYMPMWKEAVSNYNLFQQGYLDTLGVAASNASIVPAANGLTQEMKDRGVKLNKNVQIAVGYLGFNMTDPVFGGYDEKHRKLRQAISLSIDSKAYIDIISQGLDEPAQWIIPPGLAGYDPAYRNPYRQFDPTLAKAKRLLAEAGYKDGIDPKTGSPLVLNYDNYATTPELRQIVRLYQKQIEALGLHVELRQTTYPNFQDRINKKQVQFFDFGWVADYPDAENFCFLLYGPNAAPGPNATLYNRPEYNQLFERMRSMADGSARNAVIRRMRDISVEDCPWIYATHSSTRTLVQPWVRNNYASPIANDLFKYVHVDADQRVEMQRRWNHPTYWPLAVGVLLVALVCVPASATIRSRTNRRVRKVDA